MHFMKTDKKISHDESLRYKKTTDPTVKEARKEAEKDIQNDGELTIPDKSPEADLDEGELARKEGHP